MKKISAIIPTLLKNKELLIRLLDNLIEDSSVDEIIVINNSTETFSYNHNKVKIFSSGKNLYVNPSWNYGVKEAKSEYAALINDDIIIPNNFCSTILDKMNEDTGIVGMEDKFIINLRDENNNIKDIPQTTPTLSENITLKPISYRKKFFGVIMFFKKDLYKSIPEDLKIFFGDDYIVYHATQQKKQCATICGQEIIHCGSLSSSAFIDLLKKEHKIYNKLVFPWYKRLFYFYQRDDQNVFYFLFLKLSFRQRQKTQH